MVCCWGWLRGTGPALAGIAREEGLSRWRAGGKGCYDPVLVPALSRCCSGVRVVVGCEAKRFRRLRNGMRWIGDRLIGDGSRDGVLLGVAPRDRSCTRRDRTGGGAVALTRWKERLLRSGARSGPVPLPHYFFRGGGQRAFAGRGLGGIRWPWKPFHHDLLRLASLCRCLVFDDCGRSRRFDGSGSGCSSARIRGGGVEGERRTSAERCGGMEGVPSVPVQRSGGGERDYVPTGAGG